MANIKIFVFCVAAAFSAIGGAMFTLQVGFMSPTFVGIVPSIEMVIYCAVGGRLSIYGAIYGTLLVSWAKTSLSESFPELWLFGLGGLFIAVVMLFPAGIAGVANSLMMRFRGKREKRKASSTKTPSSPSASVPAGAYGAAGTVSQNSPAAARASSAAVASRTVEEL